MTAATVLPALAVLAELAVMALAGVVLWTRRGQPVAEAVAVSIVTTLAGLSALVQLAFLLGVPMLAVVVEVPLAVGAGVVVWRGRAELRDSARVISAGTRRYPVVSALGSLVMLYLAAQVFALPPANWDSMTYNLARVLLFEQAGSFLLDRVTTLRQAVFPVGSDILAHLFLRFQTDVAVAAFSLLSYVAIAAGSYALARRHAAEGLAVVATLVVVSSPELVYQATSTKNDIVVAGAAVVALIAVHRLWDALDMGDLLLLAVALVFGVSAKTNFIAFAALFVPVFGVLLVRRYGLATSGRLIGAHWRAVLVALPLLLVLSPAWLFAWNVVHWGGWSGPVTYAAYYSNPDGWSGALANLVRYGYQSAHFMQPGDAATYAVTGYGLSGLQDWAFQQWLAPLFGRLGAPHFEFHIVAGGNEDDAWYGPLGLLVAMPSIAYALWRGPRLLRATGLVLVGYVVILAALLHWTPYNNRLFAPFFATTAAPAAFMLAGWRSPRWIVSGLCLLCLVLMCYAAAFNTAKPLFPERATDLRSFLSTTWTENVWRQTRGGTDRLFFARRYFGDDRVAAFRLAVHQGARVGLLGSDDSWVYPYLMARRDVLYVPIPTAWPGGAAARPAPAPASLDYLVCINVDCAQESASPGAQTVWRSIRQAGIRPGALLRLRPALLAPTPMVP